MTQLYRRSFLHTIVSLALTSTVLTACQPLNPAKEKAATPKTAVFYLVRHAEKELEGEDPALSAQGYMRADELAHVLRDVTFDGIFSTDTRRTRDTAAPTLAKSNLDLSLYNGRALSAFAQELSDAEGNYLIVGHSNTTPDLVTALGGEGGDPINEADEYDRLYVLTREDGVVVTQLQRYP